jgi:hypothetical protein
MDALYGLGLPVFHFNWHISSDRLEVGQVVSFLNAFSDLGVTFAYNYCITHQAD